MVIIDLQIYNFLLVLVYNLQPSQTKKPIYNLQEIYENNCRFYNQYGPKSIIYKKSAPHPLNSQREDCLCTIVVCGKVNYLPHAIRK